MRRNGWFSKIGHNCVLNTDKCFWAGTNWILLNLIDIAWFLLKTIIVCLIISLAVNLKFIAVNSQQNVTTCKKSFTKFSHGNVLFLASLVRYLQILHQDFAQFLSRLWRKVVWLNLVHVFFLLIQRQLFYKNPEDVKLEI